MQQLVWSRPAEERPGERPAEPYYDRSDIAEFLKRMDDSKVLIVGHTPLPTLPEKWIHNGPGRGQPAVRCDGRQFRSDARAEAVAGH